MKLKAGVDFTNILPAVFMHAQIPKVLIDTDDLTVFFALLGSVGVKASHKMLVKLTPGLPTFCIKLVLVF